MEIWGDIEMFSHMDNHHDKNGWFHMPCEKKNRILEGRGYGFSVSFSVLYHIEFTVFDVSAMEWAWTEPIV